MYTQDEEKERDAKKMHFICLFIWPFPSLTSIKTIISVIEWIRIA